MADTFRLTLAQLNPTVGDLAGNAAKVQVQTNRLCRVSDPVINLGRLGTSTKLGIQIGLAVHPVCGHLGV